jgi:hypothetical protein
MFSRAAAKSFSQDGFREAKHPQTILSGGCGAAKPHHIT